MVKGNLLDQNVHRELWTSWASVLRSYAAAHGLNSKHHAVVEVGSEEITLRVATRWIRFTQHNVEESDGQQSEFRLEENGTVNLGGKIEEMDMAAERIARELMQ